MTRKWHARIWKLKKKDAELWRGAMAGYIDPGEFASDILLEGDYSSLFVYMFRRFGIPEFGSDPYKEIACWYITTPDPAVVLAVSPRPSGLRYSFGYQVNTSVYDSYNREDVESSEKAEIAVKEAMKDLLTPTNIRDVYINAIGRVSDDDIGRVTCDYFKWAGYGVTHDYYKKFEVNK